jgi:hypothetical protein
MISYAGLDSQQFFWFEGDDSPSHGINFTCVRGDHSCGAKPLRNTPLFWNTCCTAVNLGESGDSGHNPGLAGRAKFAVSSTFYEGFLGGGKT